MAKWADASTTWTLGAIGARWSRLRMVGIAGDEVDDSCELNQLWHVMMMHDNHDDAADLYTKSRNWQNRCQCAFPRMAKLSLQDRGWDFVPQLAALPGEAVVDKPGCAPQAVDTKLNQQHGSCSSCIPFEPSGLGLSVWHRWNSTCSPWVWGI